MNVKDAAGLVGAVALIITTAFGAVGYFETKAHAAEQAQQAAKSVDELRAEILLQRIKVLNDKPTLTATEKLELELNVKLVAAIQAAAIKK